jgi:hypothetical protein
MKVAILALLIANISLAKTVTDQYQCGLNYQWTNANFPEIAKTETNFKAKIEINHENMMLTSENKFKLENISSLENKKFKFLKKIINDKNEIVFKNFKVDINHDSDNEEYVYHNKVNDIQIYISTMDFSTWSIKLQDPKRENDYLVFINCQRKL